LLDCHNVEETTTPGVSDESPTLFFIHTGVSHFVVRKEENFAGFLKRDSMFLQIGSSFGGIPDE